jgi:major type 1 subunit fimbrin (pilin)
MLRSVKNVAIVLLMTNNALVAYADNAQLNFSGSVIVDSCTVTTVTQVVALGTVSTTVLGNVGDLSDPVSFDISLNCPVGAPDSATLTFSGLQDSSDSTLLAIDSGSGVASGVAILLADENGLKINLGSPTAVSLIPGANNTLTYSARYQSTANRADINPGTANGTAQFTLNYQ